VLWIQWSNASFGDTYQYHCGRENPVWFDKFQENLHAIATSPAEGESEVYQQKGVPNYHSVPWAGGEDHQKGVYGLSWLH